jgi:hypothetical protein
MVMVKKMLKGEALPSGLGKMAIVEKDDEVLLQCVEQNLRRMLNTEDIWTLKNKSSSTASRTE